MSIPGGHVGEDHLVAGAEPAQDLDHVRRRAAQAHGYPAGGLAVDQLEQAQGQPLVGQRGPPT